LSEKNEDKAPDPDGSDEDIAIIKTSLDTGIIKLRKELEMRSELARVVSSYTHPTKLLPNILSILCNGFGALGGAIFFMEKGTDKITLKATHGLDRSYALKYQEIHLGSHVTGKVAKNGEGMIIKDAAVDQRSTKGVVEMLRYRSAVVTPVISESEVIGIIALVSETPDFFTDKDLKMLDQIGAHISLAIVNSYLNQEIREEREKTLDILERLDEGIFEAEVKEPISLDNDLEASALEFYNKAYFTLMNQSFIKQCEEDVWLGAGLGSGFDEKQILKMLPEVISKGEVKGIERIWSGETERIFEISMVRVVKDGGIRGIEGVRRDVTARSQIQEKIQEAKAQTDFYMDLLSHDISNINTTVLGFLDMMESRVNKPQDIHRFINISREQMKRSSRMIHKIKILSKVQREAPDLFQIDISQKLESNFDRVKIHFPQKTAVLNFDPGLSAVLVRCDDFFDELVQSIFELGLEEADGNLSEIDVEIKRYEFNEEVGFLLSFSNGGGEVSDTLRERIFKRDLSSKGAPPGIGLGLSIMEAIVERYKGKIWIEDRIVGGRREGTRIMVFLPS
jgi:signal transduction histidine kinase/putative methionine-R-sulfoxide reductase with GAF domain